MGKMNLVQELVSINWFKVIFIKVIIPSNIYSSPEFYVDRPLFKNITVKY